MFRQIIFLILLLFTIETAGQTTGKNPVIIIPGVTGSVLINEKTGKRVWFGLKRNKEDDLRLPMTFSNLSRNRDGIIAKDIIREIELPGVLPDIEVYKTLLTALKGRGFAQAEWEKPVAADVFYVFPYDWRRDNVETARLLIQTIEKAKKSLNRPDLKFDILAHSMGGLIARYAAMYGSADLPPAGKYLPTWAGAEHINKLLLFGTPNQGSFSAFDVMLNGYARVSERNLPFVDDFRPQDILTYPASFQLMPQPGTARFFDENLKPLSIDIYDPAMWEKYRWGAMHDPKFLVKLKDAARLAIKNKEIDLAGVPKQLNADDRIVSQTTSLQVRAFFLSALLRAKNFHLALAAPVEKAPIQIYAYGGNCQPTLDAAILVRDVKKNRWSTITSAQDFKTSTGREVKKEEVKKILFSPGDGRVTQRSLLADNKPSNSDKKGVVKAVFPLTFSFFACALHTRLLLDKPIQDSYLSALIVQSQKQP